MTHQEASAGHEDSTDDGGLQAPGRRQALQLLSALGAAGALAASAACHSGNGITGGGFSATNAPRALSESDFLLLRRLVEVIIPETDTGGALEVGVPEFIDSVLAMTLPMQFAVIAGTTETPWEKPPGLFVDGLRWIEAQARAAYGNDFSELGGARRATFLESLYATMEAGSSMGRSAQFLRALKNLTVLGYYTSAEGLLKELGYKANMPNGKFQGGCRN